MVGGWTGLPPKAPKAAATGAATGLPSVAAVGAPRADRAALVAPLGDPGAYARFGGVAT